MAFTSPLILTEFIKEHPDKTTTKGLEIFYNKKEKIIVLSQSIDNIVLKIPSQTRKIFYTVELELGETWVGEKCDCLAYDENLECKHAVAAAAFLLYHKHKFSPEEITALLEINDPVDEEIFVDRLLKLNRINGSEEKLPEILPVTESIVETKWKQFTNSGQLSQYLLQQYYHGWTSEPELRKLTVINFDKQNLHWSFIFQQTKKEIYHPEIKYDAQKTYSYRCDCVNTGRNEMCRHARVSFDKLLLQGNNFFLQYKDWTKEKNSLLKPYGISLEDEEARLFEFYLDYYDTIQVRAPQGFYKEGDTDSIKKLANKLRSKPNNNELLIRPRPMPDGLIDFELAYVINLKSKRINLGFELEVAKCHRKAGKQDLKKLSLNTAANLPLLKQLDDEAYSSLLQISDEKLIEYLRLRGHGISIHHSNPWNHISSGALEELRIHYIKCIVRLWPQMVENENTFLLEDGNYSSKNCKPVKVKNETVTLTFEVIANEKFITIRLNPVFDCMEPLTPADKVSSYFKFLFKRNDALHLLKDMDDISVLEQFPNGSIKIPLSQKIETIQNIIVPLQERYPVKLPPGFDMELLQYEANPQVLLKEFNEQFLMLQSQFLYNDILVDYSSNPEDILIQNEDGSLQLVKRNAVKEKQFHETLRPLHDSFNRQQQNDFFYVHFNEVMKGNWFLNTVRYLQENGFVVKGMENLKRFRYNTNKPKWEMKAGSGIDWFDLSIKVTFGDEEIPFKDLRKAIINKQNIVVLGDGTFGVLPEEWLNQYSMLFKMSTAEKDGSIRLNKLHYTLIDQLHDQLDNEAILEEIEIKKQKLKNIENVKLIKHSKNIKATLRPYQLSGFQWMQTLDELGWGGCLADDMGLGKTLQTITFLQFLKEKYPGSTHLVVCPVSLIYNWETELRKFAPKLKYHIYYGTAREFSDEHFEDYDIVLTSYGLVRNDMEQMLKFNWHYVILDESQAIKNPDAKVTKAVQLLKAQNRIILSGTPVQNNSFDLYAQFNFLNPGILGSKEFYKTEFANPIDKNNDADKGKMLRQLIYPFLLRRTKEQVAKDLPDKTETILWCQMPKEQQTVYDEYKNYYRKMLAKKIEEEGMAKAGMYVLEGLLRLRQICDSPQLLKDPEITATQSIKIEELLRELEENTGEHKLLVFSQFTEMLHLIKVVLDENKISYCYLDGKTPASKRKEAVDEFQNNESIKVFLISLKAGGVGLNLTAADYVYIVDPWWNPAVEQQAIDRTHRIGQNKKIFAYKMICKDTVEEKIILLQQRKKQLANDLVTEDAGFIKKLTKEDVDFLFT
ncbi:MAG: SNF2-related protein [Ferruginibacter sp.]